MNLRRILPILIILAIVGIIGFFWVTERPPKKREISTPTEPPAEELVETERLVEEELAKKAAEKAKEEAERAKREEAERAKREEAERAKREAAERAKREAAKRKKELARLAEVRMRLENDITRIERKIIELKEEGWDTDKDKLREIYTLISKAKSSLRQGKYHSSRKYFDEAKSSLNSAIIEANLRYQSTLAMNQQDLLMYTELDVYQAERSIGILKSVEPQKNIPGVSHILAYLYLHQDQDKNVLASFHKALSSNDLGPYEKKEAHYIRALIYVLKLKSYQPAINESAAVLSLDPAEDRTIELIKNIKKIVPNEVVARLVEYCEGKINDNHENMQGYRKIASILGS